MTLVRGDITELDALERALDEHEITRVVHLAALQVPFVRANPPLGMRVNVAGTVNVFEAVSKRLDRIPGVAYASSTAVYSASDPSPAPGGGRHLAEHALRRLEARRRGHGPRLRGRQRGFPTIGLRPYVVYGPGRDQGMTSGPTMAMLAAARGEPYAIGYSGDGRVRLRARRRARLRHGRGGGARGRRRLQRSRRGRVGGGRRRGDPGRRARRGDHVVRRSAALPRRGRGGRLRPGRRPDSRAHRSTSASPRRSSTSARPRSLG